MIDDSQLDLWLTPLGWDDPYPYFHQLRERDPVRFVPWGPFWALSRHEDVEAAFSDPRLSSARPRASFQQKVPEAEFPSLQALGDYLFEFMMWMDPPAHTRQRSLVQKAFTPRALEGIRPHARQFVRQQLAKAEGGQVFDWTGKIARPLPAKLILDLLGVPEEGHAPVQSCADAISEFLGTFGEMMPGHITQLYRRVEACAEYLLPVVRERRASPRDDLLSALVAARDGGDSLTDREVIVITAILLVAGYETTTNLLSNGMAALLRHEDQLALLRREPSRLPAAIEEMLRYDPPVQMIARFANVELELGGKTIDKDSWVLLLLAAANRDPARFPDPDRFDITRPSARHFSFGVARHFCAGAMLARLEAQETFAEALERFSRWELVPERTQRRPNPGLRGFDELGVRFEV
jgi:cytochrome P450